MSHFDKKMHGDFNGCHLEIGSLVRTSRKVVEFGNESHVSNPSSQACIILKQNFVVGHYNLQCKEENVGH